MPTVKQAMVRWCGVMALMAAFTAAGSDARAQGGGPAQVIQGDVRSAVDSMAIAGATIEIAGPRLTRSVRTDEAGKFWLGQVPAGSYRLLVMRIGYAAIRQDVVVADAPADLRIVMSPEVQDLRAIVTRANVTAVYGGIGAVGPTTNAQGEKTMTAVKGATVQVLGSRKTAVTDSLGRFFVELNKPGRFIIRVTSPGLAVQLFTVDVPRNKAVDVSRLMDSVRMEAPTGREYLWGEMDRRIGWRAMNSALVSGAELRELGGNLTDALQRSKGMTLRGLRIGAATCVFVDGMPKPGFPLDAFRIEEVEAVELYGPNGDPTNLLRQSWPAGAPCAPSGRFAPANNRAIPVAQWAVIWTAR